MRQINVGLQTERAENLLKQRGRGDAVHVVVAKDDERFAKLTRAEQSRYCLVHVRQQKRISKLLEAWAKKSFDGGRLTDAAIDEALREQGGNFVTTRERPSEKWLRRGGRPAAFHGVTKKLQDVGDGEKA